MGAVPIIVPVHSTQKVNCIVQSGITYCEKTILSKEVKENLAQDFLIFFIISCVVGLFIVKRATLGYWQPELELGDYVIAPIFGMIACGLLLGLYCIIETAVGY